MAIRVKKKCMIVRRNVFKYKRKIVCGNMRKKQEDTVITKFYQPSACR